MLQMYVKRCLLCLYYTSCTLAQLFFFLEFNFVFLVNDDKNVDTQYTILTRNQCV